MGTSIVKFQRRGQTDAEWGVLRGDRVFPISRSYPHQAELIRDYFDDRPGFDAAVASAPTADDVAFLSPLSPNTQLFAQGLNYADHREESGLDEHAPDNLIFAKPGSSISGPNDAILKPRGVELLDYEIELGVVLKTDVHAETSVADDNLPDYLGGLILCNDVSARDEMFGAPMLQWFKGKGHRTFCPAGPVLFLLDPEDFAVLYELELTLKLNGVVKQHAVTAQLIHKPPKTISEISAFANMNRGDVILTGTPGGVLAGHSKKAGLAIAMNLTNDRKRREKFTAAQKGQATFLQAGDVLELNIRSADGQIDLGVQRNQVANA